MNAKIIGQLREAANQCKEDCNECPKSALFEGRYPNMCYIRRARFLLGEKVGNDKIQSDYEKTFDCGRSK